MSSVIKASELRCRCEHFLEYKNSVPYKIGHCAFRDQPIDVSDAHTCEMDKYNELIICPVCKNVEIKITDNYCMICGRKIVKKVVLKDA